MDYAYPQYPQYPQVPQYPTRRVRFRMPSAGAVGVSAGFVVAIAALVAVWYLWVREKPAPMPPPIPVTTPTPQLSAIPRTFMPTPDPTVLRPPQARAAAVVQAPDDAPPDARDLLGAGLFYDPECERVPGELCGLERQSDLSRSYLTAATSQWLADRSGMAVPDPGSCTLTAGSTCRLFPAGAPRGTSYDYYKAYQRGHKPFRFSRHLALAPTCAMEAGASCQVVRGDTLSAGQRAASLKTLTDRGLAVDPTCPWDAGQRCTLIPAADWDLRAQQ